MARTVKIGEDVLLRVARDAELTPHFVVFMAASGTLAAVAMLANSIPTLIGAMVIAPAFPPLALIAFGLAGGRPRLVLGGLAATVVGLVTAVAFAVLTTWIVDRAQIIPSTGLAHKELLEERVRPGWYSVIAAFAAGVTGTMATIKNKLDTLVGTVAALALVPAASAAGIAFLASDKLRGLGGLVLLGINIGVIVATGLIVLLVHDLGRGS